MAIDWGALGLAISVPVGRCFGGWLTKSLKDNKITKFEIKLLFETSVKVGVYGALVFFGADGIGIDLEPVAAAASGVLIQIVTDAMKETKTDAPEKQ